MTAGILVGKCRLCGRLVATEFADYELGVDEEIEQKRALGTHICADGGKGVTDLLGGRPKKEVTGGA